MSKNKIVTTIQKELARVNEQIDMKIITGRSYKKDSLRHKYLLAQLRAIRARESFNFFGKLSQSFATLVF